MDALTSFIIVIIAITIQFSLYTIKRLQEPLEPNYLIDKNSKKIQNYMGKHWKNAETTNGRLAMIGFLALIINYGFFGWIIPGFFQAINIFKIKLEKFLLQINSPFKKNIFIISKKQLGNSDFDKNGLDSYGIHWLQYAAFAVSGFAIFTTWAFFYDERFHNFVINVFKVINCSGFNCNGAF